MLKLDLWVGNGTKHGYPACQGKLYHTGPNCFWPV